MADRRSNKRRPNRRWATTNQTSFSSKMAKTLTCSKRRTQTPAWCQTSTITSSRWWPVVKRVTHSWWWTTSRSLSSSTLADLRITWFRPWTIVSWRKVSTLSHSFVDNFVFHRRHQMPALRVVVDREWRAQSDFSYLQVGRWAPRDNH